MQTLGLAAIYALVGIAAFLFRARLANLDEAPLQLRLAVGFGLGALIGLFILARGLDLLPDQLELGAVAALWAAVLVAALLVAVQARR